MSDHDLDFELPEPARTSRTTLLAVVLLVVIGGGFAFGYIRRETTKDDVATPRTTNAVRVEVVKPSSKASTRALALPGIAKALEETKIFPRTTGYVRRWLVDIGDKVTEGQRLAEIDTPELDAQLSQARAQLAQARAAVKQAIAQRTYTTSNAARYEALSDQKLVAKAQLEQTRSQAASDEATVSAQEANVAAQEANVRRLTEMQSFATVTAPFAGTITSRSINRGALLSADNATTPIYTIVATDPMRVFVEVPQAVAQSIGPGQAASITVRELPGRTFPGTIARTARALDPDLHVMTTEIDVPNSDDSLLPGSYVQAAIELPAAHQVVEIPATALYNDAKGLRVAIVDAHDRIHFQAITIEADTGATLRIATGLAANQRVVKIAVPSLLEGDAVEVVTTGAGSR